MNSYTTTVEVDFDNMVLTVGLEYEPATGEPTNAGPAGSSITIIEAKVIEDYDECLKPGTDVWPTYQDIHRRALTALAHVAADKQHQEEADASAEADWRERKADREGI